MRQRQRCAPRQPVRAAAPAAQSLLGKGLFPSGQRILFFFFPPRARINAKFKSVHREHLCPYRYDIQGGAGEEETKKGEITSRQRRQDRINTRGIYIHRNN